MPTKNQPIFSAEEKAAMQAAITEAKAAASSARKPKKDRAAEDVATCLAAIEAMTGDDRDIARKVHELVTVAAGEKLNPKTWYGMPAYANAAGKVVCFFQNAGKFKARYGTFGFNDAAALDDGSFWPTSFAVTQVTPGVAAEITRLVTKALGE